MPTHEPDERRRRCDLCDGPLYIDESGTTCPECRSVTETGDLIRRTLPYSNQFPGHEARLAAHTAHHQLWVQTHAWLDLQSTARAALAAAPPPQAALAPTPAAAGN